MRHLRRQALSSILHEHGYNWNAEYHDVPNEATASPSSPRCSLWGRIRNGQIGYRRWFAYPHKVYVPAWRLALGSLIQQALRMLCSAIIDRFTGERR